MFKSISKVGLIVALIAFVISGCTYKNEITSTSVDGEVLKEYNKVQTTKQHLEVAADKQKNVTTQTTIEGTIASLATQMMRNKKMDTNKPVLITSFVKLNEFKKTTEFGRVISESLIDELSNRGFNVIEFRGQMSVSVNDKGEYFITRKTNRLKNKVPNTYVVVGTYSRQYGKVMLNARVIDNVTGKIISSSRATFKHGKRNDCMMFRDCRPARTINIIKER
jgi:TolB-like protein